MARPNATKRAEHRQRLMIAATVMRQASDAAAASAQVEAAVTGDLIAVNPELSATIADLNDRVAALEGPIP